MTDQRLYSVPDISCDHCKETIEAEVAKVDGVNNVEVDIAGRSVLVVGGDDVAIRTAIDLAGYSVAP